MSSGVASSPGGESASISREHRTELDKGVEAGAKSIDRLAEVLQVLVGGAGKRLHP
jgi:hypothetical protein